MSGYDGFSFDLACVLSKTGASLGRMLAGVLLAVVVLAPFCFAPGLVPLRANEKNLDGYVGSLACATCHPAIYKGYVATPMAKASGQVGAAVAPLSVPPAAGEFFHARSKTHYRVFQDKGHWYFEFQKNASAAPGGEIRGRRRIDSFIGSGAHGRSYLYSVNKILFQVPIAYYPARCVWDMAPGYEDYENIFLGRIVEQQCLECHASGIRRAGVIEGHYESPAFAEGAVSCERCHGPGKAHIAEMTAAPKGVPRQIVNPAKLDPPRRDGVCAQCHLFGEARVLRSGRSLTTYRPGDLLSEHIVSFVWSSPSAEVKAVGHFESLRRSRCKQAAGDRLWCGTCHSPHSVPSPAERAAYFREKCLGCHRSSSCTASLAARNKSGNDCAACHMPKIQAADSHHASFTDHSIPKLLQQTTPDSVHGTNPAQLVTFWGGQADVRELGLAYATVAAHSTKGEDYSRAFSALRSAAEEAPADVEVLTQLGWLYERGGDSRNALRLYSIAVRSQGADVANLVNLANLLAARGDITSAIGLWQEALDRNPALEAPAINLSKVYLQKGDPISAREWLLKALEFTPDSTSALELWSTLAAKGSP
jgi:Tfp pilus assembly protein PilF